MLLLSVLFVVIFLCRIHQPNAESFLVFLNFFRNLQIRTSFSVVFNSQWSWMVVFVEIPPDIIDETLNVSKLKQF